MTRKRARLEAVAFWTLALAVVALAFAARIHALGVPNLTNDEWFMLRNHDEGPLWIIHQAHTFEPHPLLYYLGLAGWIEIAGRTEFAMRFLSVIFGVVLAAALIGLGRMLIGRRAGLIVGALVALNPYQIAESQNARNYAMVVGLSAVASLLFIRALRRQRRRDWVAYGVAMLLALNTHYDAALVLMVHVGYVVVLAAVRRRRPSHQLSQTVDGLVLAQRPDGPLSPQPSLPHGGKEEATREGTISRSQNLALPRAPAPSRIGPLPAPGRGRERGSPPRPKSAPRDSQPPLPLGEGWGESILAYRPWLITTAVILVIFGLWLLYAWPALLAYHGYFPKPVGFFDVASRSLATFSLGETASVQQALPAFALGAIGLAWLAWRAPRVSLFLAGYTVLPLVAVSLLFLIRPMFDPRYLIVLAPGYLLLLAAGLEGLIQLALPVGVLASVGALVVLAPTIPRTYQTMLTDRPNFRAMATWIKTDGNPTDPIIATGYGQAELFQYYAGDGRPVEVLDQPSELSARLPVALRDHAGVWLLPYLHNPADNAALGILNQTAALAAQRWFVNTRALYYASPQRLTNESSARATWDDQISLNRAALTAGVIAPGEAAAAELHWEVKAPIATPKISLRLLDGSGALVAQSDAPLSSAPRLHAGAMVTRIGLLVPPVVPPGKYSLAILLYQPDSGAALPLSTSDSTEDAALVLGSVQVDARQRPVPSSEAGIPLIDPVHFPAGVSLLGHDALGPPQPAGGWLSFRLLWRADRTGGPPITRTLSLEGDHGYRLVISTGPILPSYPTSKWRAGQLLEAQVRAQIPPTALDGRYQLGLAVGSDQTESVNLGGIVVSGPKRSFTRPTVPTKIDARFGTFATLLGARVDDRQPRRGTAVPVTLLWSATGTAPKSYTAFVHLVGPDGKIQGQVDQVPLNGARPTDGWIAGEYLTDAYAPRLAANAPVGHYQITVGLYDPTTGVRVPVVTRDGQRTDHVVVGAFDLAGAP